MNKIGEFSPLFLYWCGIAGQGSSRCGGALSGWAGLAWYRGDMNENPCEIE